LEGTDNPATVVVDEKKSVIAVFIKKAYTLNIETEGQGTVNEEILPLIASGKQKTPASLGLIFIWCRR
jgi:hypothetical protein